MIAGYFQMKAAEAEARAAQAQAQKARRDCRYVHASDLFPGVADRPFASLGWLLAPYCGGKSWPAMYGEIIPRRWLNDPTIVDAVYDCDLDQLLPVRRAS